MANRVTLGILDLGCSGGPDGIFLDLNDSGVVINYHGYDFNDEEIKRLSKDYPPGFLFHSKKIVTKNEIEIDDKWWRGFSAGQASAEADITRYSKSEIVDNNFWSSGSVTKATSEISLQQILKSTNTDFNLLKIDLDGPDLGYLKDFFASSSYSPQFVSLEINYQGSGSPNSNTFHNSDRHMKELGYDLVAITNRTYSSKVLPSRFMYKIFAQTIKGVPYQGDALYFKKNKHTNLDEILRDIILLDAFNLEDLAAEIVLENTLIFSKDESSAILDVLTREVWQDSFKNYSDLITKWNDNKSLFFPEEINMKSQSENEVADLRIKEVLKILISKIYKRLFCL